MGILDLFRGRNFRKSGTFDKFHGIYFRELGAYSRKFLSQKFFVAKISSLKVFTKILGCHRKFKGNQYQHVSKVVFIIYFVDCWVDMRLNFGWPKWHVDGFVGLIFFALILMRCKVTQSTSACLFMFQTGFIILHQEQP